MSCLFADTSFYIATLTPEDQFHEHAMYWSDQHDGGVITTEYVLVEAANWLASFRMRSAFEKLLASLQEDPQTLIVPGSHDLFRDGCDLFHARPDKTWSLTDCISFVVMRRENLKEALTTDHHFEQAGFVALLR